MITIRPYDKPNGKRYYRVFLNGVRVGQFFTRANAERFVACELRPLVETMGAAAVVEAVVA